MLPAVNYFYAAVDVIIDSARVLCTVYFKDLQSVARRAGGTAFSLRETPPPSIRHADTLSTCQ